MAAQWANRAIPKDLYLANRLDVVVRPFRRVSSAKKRTSPKRQRQFLKNPSQHLNDALESNGGAAQTARPNHRSAFKPVKNI